MVVSWRMSYILVKSIIFILPFLPDLINFCMADEKCFFSGKAYSQNDIWYPKIPTEDSICVKCNCLQAGKIDCSPRQCPKDCSSDNADKECCQICQDNRKNDKQSAAKVEKDSSGKQDKMIPCMHNGIKYDDGKSFTSNSTGLKAQRTDQCVQCVCKRGLVLCRLKTCPKVSCSTPIEALENCCPVCQGDDEQSSSSSEDDGNLMVLEDAQEESDESGDSKFSVTFYPSKSNNGKKKKDCVSATKRYTHGSSWHPIIGPFGQMQCVICNCQFGRIECQRVSCTPKHKLPCTEPVLLSGTCCHVCPSSDSKGSDKRTKPRKGTKKDKVTKPNNDNYITATQVFSLTEKKVCLPSTSPVIVYKSHASTDTSGYYQYAFQPSSSTTDGDFDVYSWTFSDGQFGYFATQHLSKTDFLVLSSTFTFQVLGATQKKYTEKFVKRAKRLQKKCTNKCHRRMERLQRNLKLLPVVTRVKSCLENEVSLPV